MSETRDYFLEVASYIRKNYDGTVEETRRLERYIIAITGITWGWCADKLGEPETGFHILIWFPFLASFLFGLRALGLAKRIELLKIYLQKIESELEIPEELRWSEELEKFKQGVSKLIGDTAHGFWRIWAVITFLVPIAFSLCPY